MALDFNKAQDAVVEFLKGLQLRAATLFARSGAAADEVGQTADAAEKSIQTLTPELKQVLDVLEGVSGVFDAAKATLNEIRRSATGVDIDVETPSGSTWHICVRQGPQEEA